MEALAAMLDGYIELVVVAGMTSIRLYDSSKIRLRLIFDVNRGFSAIH